MTTTQPLASAQPLIGVGEVRHARLRPVRHAFSYPTFFLLLPMRSLRAAPSAALPRNRFGLIAFHDRDHGEGGADSLAWLDGLLAREGIADADGEIWLHCMPRVLGYAFKPVSFWYCHRADRALAAIVVEVNNTFGERHFYLLRESALGTPDAPGTTSATSRTGALGWGRELQARKVFHVSPFCTVEGRYRFRFFRNDSRTVARVEHDDAAGPLLVTSVSGELATLTPARLRQAFWRMPLMTLGVVARIHWQALRLWLRRVPFVSKPEPPAAPLSRGEAATSVHATSVAPR